MSILPSRCLTLLFCLSALAGSVNAQVVDVRTQGRTPLFSMPGQTHRGSLPPLNAEQQTLAQQLKKDVQFLAGTIGERNVYRYAQLVKAERFLISQLESTGFKVRRETYQVRGRECANLVVELAGSGDSKEIIIVGAHYDSAVGTPGANDNGSGTAAALALARAFHGKSLRRTLRFVFFVNEEGPWFQTDQMGSLVYAAGCRRRNENILAMYSLETIGYYRDEAGSQQYPAPFSQFYPSTGNFIAFVGNTESGPLTSWTVKTFRDVAPFPSEGTAAPSRFSSIGRSDQWSFWRYGYPGVMITDTANFRYPHYHARSDTHDKVNYNRLARVVAGLQETFSRLANEEKLEVEMPRSAPVAANTSPAATRNDSNSGRRSRPRLFRFRLFRR